MKEECLICKASLEYLQEDVMMECSICHKNEFSKTRCVNGHYVCNECHSKGVDSIVGLCLNETSCDPIEIIGKMMDMSFCHKYRYVHFHNNRLDSIDERGQGTLEPYDIALPGKVG